MTELSRPLPIDRVGTSGLEHSVEADAAELAPLAARLQIPAVKGLRCAFRLRRLPGAVIAAEGDLVGRVVQTCVVSLEDFEQDVAEAFSVQFVPAGTEASDDDLEAPDQIPYEHGAIDLGEAAAQQLALALDPYPRAPGAEPAIELADELTPFAALLRPR